MSRTEQIDTGMGEKPEETRYHYWMSKFVTVFAVISGLYFLAYISGIFEFFHIFINLMAHRALFLGSITTLLWLAPWGKVGRSLK